MGGGQQPVPTYWSCNNTVWELAGPCVDEQDASAMVGVFWHFPYVLDRSFSSVGLLAHQVSNLVFRMLKVYTVLD